MSVLSKTKLVKLYREYRRDPRRTALECYSWARSECYRSDVVHQQGYGVTNSNRKKRRSVR